jgi:ABC-type Fe3+ transport system substrate-binding protein
MRNDGSIFDAAGCGAFKTFGHLYWIRHSSFLALCLFILLAGCRKEYTSAADVPHLLVISPHNSDIRREFGDAFSKWHQAHYGTPVKVEWPDIGGGGTGNILRQLNAAYDRGDSSGYDVIFGGGSASFNQLASQKDAAGKARNILVKLPPLAAGEHDPLDDIPAALFGNPLHGVDGVWTAATMSRFGFAINKDRIAELKLRTPRTWEDLAQPEWLGLLSLGDPSKSGSVRTCYEQIFQTYGWEKGWAILTEMFANATAVREGGSNPADDVGNAEAVAGVVIDFFGRLQISRVGDRIVGFVVPEGKNHDPGGGSVLDPDPIALLRGAPHEEIAARFIRFVLSPEGQRLWVVRVGAGAGGAEAVGGPTRTSLGRLSVLPSLYQTDAANMLDPANPFADASALHVDNQAQSLRSGFIGDLIKAALIDNQVALVRARKSVHAAGDSPALLEELTAVPLFRIHGGSPQALVESQLKAMATEYNPPKDDPRSQNAERIQNDTRDFWRASFASRFAEVEKAAKK